MEQENAPVETTPETPSTENAPTSAPEQAAPEQAVQPEAQEQQPINVADELYTTDEPEASEEPAPSEPIEYDFEGVAAEDGSEILERDIASIKDLSKELNLSNDQARDLLSKSGKYINENLRAKQAALVQGWVSEIKNDPQLGGTNFNNTRANLSRAIKRYGGGGAFEILNASGLGAHPAIVRMLNAIGKDLGQEQRFVNSQTAAPKRKDPLRSIYDKSPALKFGD